MSVFIALATFAFVVGLSLLAGFAAQRGSLCAVAATQEVIRDGRWHRFVGFLQCAAWAWLLLLIVGLWQVDPGGLAGSAPAGYRSSLLLAAVVGGALFGVGALINGGCSFGTVARLGRGDMSYLLSLLAMLIGFTMTTGQWSWLSASVTRSDASFVTVPDSAMWLLQGALALLVVVNSVQLYRHRAWRAQAWQPHTWPPVMAVLVIALCNLGLLWSVGQWPGIAAPVGAFRGDQVGLLRWLVLPVFIAGATWEAINAKRFRWVRPDLIGLTRRCVGGFIMGAGAAGVPGGNGRMLLVDTPAMHWHGVLAYAAMVTALLAVIGAMHRLGMRAE